MWTRFGDLLTLDSRSSGSHHVEHEERRDDGEPFKGKMKRLTTALREQQAEAAKLDAVIVANLEELGYGG